MLDRLLEDILEESKKVEKSASSEQVFIETILNNIYQFLYKAGQPVHTVAIGILRGNTFDMYYRGRILDRFAELFGAMSYDTTIAGRACELFKSNNISYLHLFSKKKIIDEFERASKELEKQNFKDEAKALRKRAETTIDQGIGSFLLIPLTYGSEVIGIFTISSMKEYDESHILGEDISRNFLPMANMLSLLLYMEKISYDKADEMGRLLVSSIDGKDEYQTSHSSDVRKMIDIFIDELSRDKELRERVEGIGFKLTVDKIEKLRLAALLHDMGKVFVPSSVLRKGSLNKEELLLRKMHSYCTYNMLSSSKTLGNIADIASKHHARYFIPIEKYEGNFIGFPFDRVGQDKFHPESQIIALADTFNSIVRARPDRDGLSFSEAVSILQRDDHKFHSGLKDIFLTIMCRVEKNINENKYSSEICDEYRTCLWLEKSDKVKQRGKDQWSKLHSFFDKIKYNTIGIIALMHWKDAKSLIEKKVNFKEKPFLLTVHNDKHVILSLRDIPMEEGFVWIFNLLDFLKKNAILDKIAIAFIGKNGKNASISDMYESLVCGLNDIKNEPVHYYLNSDMFKIK